MTRALRMRWTSTLVAGLVSAVLVALAGCGDSAASARAQAQRADDAVNAMLIRLREDLANKRVPNAALILGYADAIARARPELKKMTDVLRLEGTANGRLYKGLRKRLDDNRAATPPPDAPARAYEPVLAEYAALRTAADPAEFSRALSDPLNALADLSDGMLPRVDAISATASQRANAADSHGPGSQLVGNPHYGSWQTNSSGSSFWVWYGQYALISSLLGGPRIGYGDWSGRRDYSYYHDWGRDTYTSPSDRRRQGQVDSTARRKFASEGRTFRSPYARQRQGASSRVVSQKAFAGRQGVSSMRGFGGGSRGPIRGK